MTSTSSNNDHLAGSHKIGAYSPARHRTRTRLSSDVSDDENNDEFRADALTKEQIKLPLKLCWEDYLDQKTSRTSKLQFC